MKKLLPSVSHHVRNFNPSVTLTLLQPFHPKSASFPAVNLFELFGKVQQMGGYDIVTAKQEWKFIHDQMSGDSSSVPPSAAGNTLKRHYER